MWGAGPASRSASRPGSLLPRPFEALALRGWVMPGGRGSFDCNSRCLQLSQLSVFVEKVLAIQNNPDSKGMGLEVQIHTSTLPAQGMRGLCIAAMHRQSPVNLEKDAQQC